MSTESAKQTGELQNELANAISAESAAENNVSGGGIKTRCPACHFTTLVINCGQLLCTWHKCPDPTLIHRQGETESAAEDNIDDGGPAFPTFGSATQIVGMSLLDYFAAQALAGIHAASNHSNWQPLEWHESAAICAYQAATSMLTERERIHASVS